MEGAEVTLTGDGRGAKGMQTTDAFGDFRIDGLVEGSGIYVIRIEHEGYQTATMGVDLRKSVNVGTIFLARSS